MGKSDMFVMLTVMVKNRVLLLSYPRARIFELQDPAMIFNAQLTISFRPKFFFKVILRQPKLLGQETSALIL